MLSCILWYSTKERINDAHGYQLKMRVVRYAADFLLRKLGYFPRYPFAHFFLHDGEITSTLHIHNFYSVFFPDIKTSTIGRVWLHDSNGNLIRHKRFEIPPFGQVYLSAKDLLDPGDKIEGMVYVDLKPTKKIRARLRRFPNSRTMVSQTPFWVSYVDADQNYMYVHSIDTYKGKILGSLWPRSQRKPKKTSTTESWKSWRILDLSLLSELEVIVMNHSSREGRCNIQIWSDDDSKLWEFPVTMKTRETKRVSVPQSLISELSESQVTRNIRVGIDGLLTPNGKPYVLMRYGVGPRSLHHG
jgi:hypothetical protein